LLMLPLFPMNYNNVSLQPCLIKYFTPGPDTIYKKELYI
jgi:hypothetical protein